MKKCIVFIFSVLLLAISFSVSAQPGDSSTEKTYRVGIFTSLYLDSVFTGDEYRYDKQMPKYVLPGLDFVEGAQIALDSFNANGHRIEAYLYDLRSASKPLTVLYATHALDSLDLIIGSASGTDFKELADIAKAKNIPFISATYPNDGGIIENPFTIILNSTLTTHCEAIYKYILQTNPTSNILFLKRNAAADERISHLFTEFNSSSNNKPLLKMPVVVLPDTGSVNIIKYRLDSTRMNTIIVGSLDEAFGIRIAEDCEALAKQYPINLMGMPNWDGIKEFSKPDFKDLPIYYSATYFNPETNTWSNSVNNAFNEKTNGKAMDMVFKGFECTYYFLSVLLKDKTNFMNKLNDGGYRIFTEYDIKPVHNNKLSVIPDYFENKKIYLLKKMNGVVTKAN